MFQIKRGCEIGDIGNNETAFEKTINFFKNDVGCAEISRTGQASDKSLTVELRYRDFPNFSLAMVPYSYKAKVSKFGEKTLLSENILATGSREADVVLSENLLAIIVDKYFFALGKNNLGKNLFFPTWNKVGSSDIGDANNSKDLRLFPTTRSPLGKVLILDVFCPHFEATVSGSSIDFSSKVIGIKNVSGIGDFPLMSRFGVDGKEYVRITENLCAEVTS